MKVFLVRKDNGETYEDYREYIDSTHTSYRSATKVLLEDGFKPYPQYAYHKKEWRLIFNKKSVEDGLTDSEIDDLLNEDKENGVDTDRSDYENWGYEVEYGAEILEYELQE